MNVKSSNPVADREDQLPYYEVDGQKYPRVTVVLDSRSKPWIDAWKLRVGEEEATRRATGARVLGTLVHKHVEDINAGLHKDSDWKIDENCYPMIQEYLKWHKDNVNEILYNEQTVISRQFGYGGRLDAVGRVFGELEPSLLDFKTSSSKSSDWALQLAAYRQAAEETFGLVIPRRRVIHITKTPPYTVKVYNYENHELDFNRWLSVLYWWKERQQTELEDALVDFYDEPSDEEIEQALSEILGIGD